MTSEACEALKPCPFCGGNASFERCGTARQSCIIACDDCGARLETGEVFAQGRTWNTRFLPPQPDPDVEAMAKALEKAIGELEHSGLAHDHPSVAEPRAALATYRASREQGGRT